MEHDIPVVSISIRRASGWLYRSGHLTPYFAEILARDLRCGGTERPEVVVRGGADALRVVRDRLVPLSASGVRIVFRPERSAA